MENVHISLGSWEGKVLWVLLAPQWGPGSGSPAQPPCSLDSERTPFSYADTHELPPWKKRWIVVISEQDKLCQPYTQAFATVQFPVTFPNYKHSKLDTGKDLGTRLTVMSCCIAKSSFPDSPTHKLGKKLALPIRGGGKQVGTIHSGRFEITPNRWQSHLQSIICNSNRHEAHLFFMSLTSLFLVVSSNTWEAGEPTAIGTAGLGGDTVKMAGPVEAIERKVWCA